MIYKLLAFLTGYHYHLTAYPYRPKEIVFTKKGYRVGE